MSDTETPPPPPPAQLTLVPAAPTKANGTNGANGSNGTNGSDFNPNALLGPPPGGNGGGVPPTNSKKWLDLLDRKPDNTTIDSTLHNARVFMENHEDFKGNIVWNEYAKKIEIKGGPLLRYNKQGAEAIVAGAQDYLSHNHKIVIKGFADLARRIMIVARANGYNPLIDHLMSLKWDGVPRIDNLFPRYFGAGKFAIEDEPTEEELIRLAHLRCIGRYWLLGAVERAFRPGCKVDNILILEGLQGSRKTSAVEALGGKFYCSTQISLGDKDSKMIAACNWLVDMPDSKFMSKANRGFVTMRSDTFRPPFSATVEHMLRCCIFIGSMNDYQYFEEDERRYWPVRCTFVDVPALIRDCENIWAEAVFVSLASTDCLDCQASTNTVSDQLPRCSAHRWWCEADEEKISLKESSERVQDIPWKLRIHEWWLDTPVEKRPAYFTCEDVAVKALTMSEDQFTRSLGVFVAIGTAVRSLGFLKDRITINGARHWVYKPTPVLLKATKVTKQPRMMSVPYPDDRKEAGRDEELLSDDNVVDLVFPPKS